MKTEMLSTRIDSETKFAFNHICAEIGLSPSQAIKLFAKAVINHGGIPFELKAAQPNAATAAAIAELERGNGKTVPDVNQLFSEIADIELNDA